MEIVKTCSYSIPETLLERFKNKTLSEGYTIQEAVLILIKQYVEGN